MMPLLRKSPSRQTGFTLLEVLVASAIFALIGAGSYAMLNRATATKESIEIHNARLTELQRTLYRMETELLQAQPRPVRENYGDRLAAFTGDQGGSRQGAILEFTRSGWFNPVGAQRSEMQRIIYRFNENTLERLAFYHLDRAVDSEPVIRTVLDKVTNVQFRFHNGSEWLTQWPVDDNNEQSPLPAAVEMTLELEDMGTITRLFRVRGGI